MARRTKFQDANPTVDLEIQDRHYVFDEDSGEIYEWPEGESRKMDRILELAHFAADQAKTWENSANALKGLVRRLMESAGVERVMGGAGGASLQPFPQAEHVRSGAELAQWCRDVEFPPAQWLSLVTCINANGTNPAALRYLCEELGLDRLEESEDGPTWVRESDKVIDVRPGTWVRLDASKTLGKFSREGPR